jgi:hypothetical protein
MIRTPATSQASSASYRSMVRRWWSATVSPVFASMNGSHI